MLIIARKNDLNRDYIVWTEFIDAGKYAGLCPQPAVVSSVFGTASLDCNLCIELLALH